MRVLLCSLVLASAVGCGPIEDPNYPHADPPVNVEVPPPAPGPPPAPPRVGPPAPAAEPPPAQAAQAAAVRHESESFAVTLAERGIEERIEVEVDRTSGACTVEAQAAGGQSRARLDDGSCERLFGLVQASGGSWGASGLGCTACARVTGKYVWKDGFSRGAKAATFPRDMQAQDDAGAIYRELGRLGRRAGAALVVFP